MSVKDNTELHSGVAWAIMFALVAMILSIFTICKTCPKSESDFNYLGFLVGILSLLIAVLLGWQILSTIGISHKMSNAERRIEIGENRIKNMLKNIENVKEEVCKTSDSSKDMTIGVIRLSSALTLFYDTINDKKSDDLKTHSYIRCYALSAGALAKFLNLSKDSEAQIIFNDVCLQILNGSAERIFKTISSDDAYTFFDKNTHEKCENHYLNIIRQSNKLTDTQRFIIETNHANRTSLLSNIESNSQVGV